MHQVFTIKRYSRELIQKHFDKIFVFGDNLDRYGLGGQAKAARGESNSLGIVTKIDPSLCYVEEDFKYYVNQTENDFRLLDVYYEMGKTIVLPKDGIGTGLADLHNTAPSIMEYIDKRFNFLASRALNKEVTNWSEELPDFSTSEEPPLF